MQSAATAKPAQAPQPGASARAAAMAVAAVVAVSLLGGCGGVRQAPPLATPDDLIEKPRTGRAARKRGIPAPADAGPGDALSSYIVKGKRYWVRPRPVGHRESGEASWYGGRFNGRPTSSREIFDMNKLTAAHRTLPLPSYVKVTNLKNRKSVVVRVNDRGPFLKDRIIDLSYAAASRIDMVNDGVVPVVVEVLRTPVRPGAFIQVGSYSSRHRAVRVATLIRRHNLKPFVEKTRPFASRPVYRVRLGPFASPELVVVEKLLKDGGFHNYIVLPR